MTLLKKIFYKYHKQLIIFTTAILVLVNIINLYFITEISPISNDECLWIPVKKGDKVKLYFDNVKFNGVTWDAGIRDGDTLVAINDIKIKSSYHATIVLNAIPEGHYAKYTYKRGSATLETKVYVKKLINYGNLGMALMSFIWLIVAFIVIMAKHDGYTQRIFYRIAVALSVYSLGGGILNRSSHIQSVFGDISYIQSVLGNFWIIAASYAPVFLLHFFWIFPDKLKIIKYKHTKKVLYSFPLFITAATFAYIYTFGNEIVMWFSEIYFYFLFVAMIVGLKSLFFNYLKLKDRTLRTPIFIILLSYAFTIAILVYSQFFAGLLADDIIFNSPEYYAPIILIAILPVSFGYSIFKYSLLDVSEVAKSTIIYGIATITLAFIYFFVVYVLGQSLSSFFETEYQGALTALFFIIFALIFQSTKEKLQYLLTKKFYPEQFAFRKIILEFSNNVISIVGKNKILEYVKDTFIKSVQLKAFAILMDEKSNYRYAVGSNVNSGLCLDVDKDKIKKMIVSKKALSDYPVIQREDFQYYFGKDYHKLINEGIYTIIPINLNGNILGLFLLGLKHSGAQFIGKDLELLIASSNQIAIAIENARLYESEADKLKYFRDLENARKIQEALLPRRIPDIYGLDISGTMIPAMHVGGDYYDIIKVSESKAFIAIGDVSGKGLSASLYMTKLQTMIKLACNEHRTPSEILKEVNKFIYNDLDKKSFITLTLALFDIDKMEVKICRAGHTPILIEENGKVNYCIPKGIGVGLDDGNIFNKYLEEVSLKINKGKKVIFYSDGVNEAMDIEGKLFGDERLADLLTNCSNADAGQSLNSIMLTLDSFRGGAEQNDDLTLVIVNVMV